MNLYKDLSNRTKSVACAIAGTGVFLLLVTGWPLRRPSRVAAAEPAQSSDIHVANMTKSFTVVKTSVNGRNRVGARQIALSLRNDYDKAVTAYAAGRDGVYSRRDLITAQAIPPGGTVEFQDATPPPPDDAGVVVTVLAVVLEDGSGDGDPKIVQEFLDSRAAELAQEVRIKRLLEKAAAAADEKFPEEFEALKSKVLGLPVKEAGRSFHYNAALNDTRNLELYHLDQLQRIRTELGSDECRARLMAAIERKSIKMAKLAPRKLER
jgi:hypothetical protein